MDLYLLSQNKILLGILGGLFTSILNALGAASIFIFKKPSQKFLDIGLGFAAGVLIFVIANEIIPEIYKNRHERISSFSMILGLVIMLVLDVILRLVKLERYKVH